MSIVDDKIYCPICKKIYEPKRSNQITCGDPQCQKILAKLRRGQREAKKDPNPPPSAQKFANTLDGFLDWHRDPKKRYPRFE